MTIEEVYNNKEISVRSYNVCRRNGIDSIVKLQQYYTIYQTFEKLHNCGRRSNEELIEIYFKYQDYIEDIDNTPKIAKNHLEETLFNLTRIQRDVINSFIQVNTNSFSVRSKNAISIYLGNNFSVRNFIEKILISHSFKIEKIEKIGRKSIPELEIYISIISDMITEVSQSNDEKQLISLKNTFLIQQTFSISKIPNDILQSESIFQLTDFLLDNNAFFNESHAFIFRRALKIYQNKKELTLKDIANENDLSKERIRQIRKDCVDMLFEKLSFIKNFNDDLFQNYGIDKSSSLIEVNESLANRINKKNQTNFSQEFISYILAVYLSDDFIVIGNIEDVILPKFSNSRNRHNWNNFYIINKKLFNVDFLMFADDIADRLSERIEETYYFNFKSYLSRFISELNIEIIDLTFPIAEKIINDEFSLYLDIDDNVIFKRNTIIQIPEILLEILEELGVPSSLEQIYQIVQKKYPELTKSPQALRGSLLRVPNIIKISRSSTYGLKKWEKQNTGVKGGTIRSIVTEFLQQIDEPKHISEIANLVIRYRPNTNEKSIYYNLKMDESNTFSFFKNSHIGLKVKKYSGKFEFLEESNSIIRNSWEDRYDDLQKFMKLENRLPFSNGAPEDEIQLYRWLNVQKSKMKKDDFDEQKRILIIEVFNKFTLTNGRRRGNSIQKYDILIEFIKKNKRLPIANKQGEETLYQFFYKQRKLYDNNELNNDETSNYFKVYKILKSQNI